MRGGTGRIVWLGVNRGASAGSPAGPVELVSDTFNRANSAGSLGTADSGQAWTADRGTWGINGNQAYCSADDSGINVATLPASADGTFAFTLADPAGGSGGAAWGVVRAAVGATEFIYLECSTIAPYQLYTYDEGVVVALGSGSPGAAVAGDAVEIVLLGTAIKVYVNEVLVIDTTSAFQLTGARVGIGTDYGLDGSARFDDLSFNA
jgi:hypothetical protein